MENASESWDKGWQLDESDFVDDLQNAGKEPEDSITRKERRAADRASMSALFRKPEDSEDQYPFGEGPGSDITSEDVARAQKDRAIAALQQAFSGDWFDICPIGNLIGYDSDDSPARRIISELHCKEFSAMPMDVRVVLYRAVMQSVRAKVPSLEFIDFPFPKNLCSFDVADKADKNFVAGDPSGTPGSPRGAARRSRTIEALMTASADDGSRWAFTTQGKITARRTIYRNKQIVFGALVVIVATLSALAFLMSGHPSGTESAGYSSRVIESMRVAPGIASAPVAPPQPIAQPEVHRAPPAEPAH
ncbi:hypothetical protein ACSDBR_01710 [Acidithiobacillus ferriphilus]|uniref:hypothetical protein n=1 Tax=Acidithiobacillus ferriphilus TaxID=1689834 RepID=UPI003F51122E